MIKLATILQLLFLLLVFLPQAVFSQDRCEDIFGSFDMMSWSTPYAVAFKSETSSGGSRIVSFIENKHLDKMAESKTINPHGYISAASTVLGSSGPFWGFKASEIYTVKIFTQPNVTFLNEAIIRFNSNLRRSDRIQFNFLEVQSKIVGDIEFIMHHGNRIFVVGKDGSIRMHDMNYHVLANLAIDTAIHEAAFAKSRIISEFYKFLVEYDLLNESMAHLMELAVKNRAQIIDATGNILVYLRLSGQSKTDFVKALSEEGSPALLNYAKPSETPRDYLLALLVRVGKIENKQIAKKIENLINEFLNINRDLDFTTKPRLPQTEAGLAILVYDRYQFLLKNSSASSSSP